MDKFLKNIDRQIEFNQGKNIFHNNQAILQFIDDTVDAISNINKLNEESKNFLVDYTTERALEEFTRINQYYSFNSKSKHDLREIYLNLFSKIQKKENSLVEISGDHYKKLQEWLKKYNSFAERMYSDKKQFIEPVPCAEYKASLQIDILGIDINKMLPPVLDIGCGKEGKLIKFLISRGILAYGIDRFLFSNPNLSTSDWLEYDYGIKKWGTIVSNLGFSNHFTHHNLREDGNYIGYAKTYMNILHSLKQGGCFHYAPDLPFIEKFLDYKQFEISKYKISEYDFMATKVKRL